MFDKIFILVLLLNLTGLFSFIAPQFNVDLATVSLVLLALNCLYVAVNHRMAQRIFRKKQVFYWSIFLLFWPLLATIYAPATNFRELGLQVYYFTLLLGTAVYFLKNGMELFHRIVTFAVMITVLGLVLSMFTRTLFEPVASITRYHLRYEGRAYGFFMQPNLAAMNFTFLFVAWFAGSRKDKFVPVFLSLLGLCVVISLTGSRGGSVVTVAVVSLIFINRSVRVMKPFTILISPKSIVMLLLVVGGFLACIHLLLGILPAHLPEHVDDFDIVARMEATSQMRLTERSSEGESTVAGRMELLGRYFAMVCENPILGNGFGSATILQAKGVLGRSSHNQYLNIAFETGMFRVTLYLLLLFSIYMHPERQRTERLLRTNSYAQLLTAVILAGMISGVVLDSRVLYCVLGCFIAMLISPQAVADDVAPEVHAQESECSDNLETRDEE